MKHSKHDNDCNVQRHGVDLIMTSDAAQSHVIKSVRVLGFLLHLQEPAGAGSAVSVTSPHLPELPPAATGACSASATCSADGPPLGTPCTEDGAPQTAPLELASGTYHKRGRLQGQAVHRRCCSQPAVHLRRARGRAEGRQELPAALDLLPPPPPAPPLLRRQQVYHLSASQSNVGLHRTQAVGLQRFTAAAHGPVPPAP